MIASLRSFRFKAAALAALLSAAAVLFYAHSVMADGQAARGYVEDLGKRVLAVVSNKAAADTAKQKTLEDMFFDTIDAEWIGRFVLGQYWRQASSEQKNRYTGLYRQFLVKTYVSRFREYTGETFTVTAVRETEPGEFLVQTEIRRPQGENVRVDYRLRQEGKGYRVFDLIIEGVSLLTTQRSEFGAVIQRKGMDEFLKKLEARVNKLSQEGAAPTHP